MDQLFFGGWGDLLRTLLIGVLAYILLVVFLRLTGRRTLSKMNAFDLVVTVALGSTLATILLNKDVALAEGALAFALLIGMQFVVTWSSVRAGWVRRLVTGEPQLLLYRGAFLPEAMQGARVTRDEVRAAVRAAGFPELAGAEAVVLETDGSFSVVRHGDGAGASSLAGVRGVGRADVADARRHPPA
ncbi:MAG TPA: YetF domain-containing protein [Woeseiaceae bacterium]|nr:YetF domain-containing protein [Woeseiaceae bacterium]